MGCGGSKTTATTPRRQPAKGSNRGGGGGAGGGSQKQRNRQGGGGGSVKQTPRQAVNEKTYKKRIRENLRQATAGDDIPHLEKCIQTFEGNHLDDAGDLSDAYNRLEFLQLRKEIRDACLRNHPVVLDKAIAKVEGSAYRRQLQPWVQRAQYLKQNQEELNRFRHGVSQLEQPTISEIRSYKKPPEGIHQTMTATYMVVGYKEEDLQDWADVTSLMGGTGKKSLIREVLTADTRYLNDHTAVRAKHYLNQYSLEEIRERSSGAAAFHVWCQQMIGKYEGDKKSGNQLPPRDADLPKRGNRPSPKKEQQQPLSKEEKRKQDQQKKRQQEQEKQRLAEQEKRRRLEAEKKAKNGSAKPGATPAKQGNKGTKKG